MAFIEENVSRARSPRPARIGRMITAFAASALCLAIGALASSCSLVVDLNADQCEKDDDCSKFPGTTCQNGVCVTGTSKDCEKSADCSGATTICRKDTFKCVDLVSTACSTLVGDPKNDSSFLIGSILPTTVSNESTGKSIENSIKLAINDFVGATNGLPPAPGESQPRPFLYIGCTDESNGDKAVLAAKHLVEDVGVQAIIGAAFSGITIKFTTTVTIPNDVLVISPSATSVAITDLADKGLVWRTSPSDIFQAKALEFFSPQIEAKVRTDLGLTPTDKIKIAIVHKGDAYGEGLAKALEQNLMFNGDAATNQIDTFYKRIDYGNPDDTMTKPTKYPETVSEMVSNFRPHILFSLGTDEAVLDIVKPIEEQWQEQMYRSYYIFGDGGYIAPLWGFVSDRESTMAPGATTLRTRVSGTVPGTNNQLFNTFSAAYKSAYPNDMTTDPAIFGAAGGYDIVYLLAYSAVANGDKPLTGPNLAEGLKKMVGGATEVKVGSGISQAFNLVAGGNAINFTGASGPLDFDVATGEAPSDIQIWCLKPSGAGGKNSGYYYDVVLNNMGGTLNLDCN